MQDSLEDYIQISKNTKNNIEDETIKIQKEILATAHRKKECETYAMKIVMFLLDGKLRPEIFLKCLKYINQDYYQDVIEERAITKLCGYPLCGKKIPDMPKKKYFISTKANKVYDISERKNYCSNFCYKGSVHVKKQIDSSPLWLRNHAAMVDCKLLPTTAVGIPGEEIDQGITKAAPESPPIFTSVTQFTQLSLEVAGEMEKSFNKSKKNDVKNKNIQKPQSSLQVINEDDAVDSQSESEKSDFDFHESSDEDLSHDNTMRNEKNASRNIHKISNEKLRKENGPTAGNKEKKITKEGDKLEYLISKLKMRNEPKVILIEPPPVKIETKNKTDTTKLQEHPDKLKTEQIKQKTASFISKEAPILVSNEVNGSSQVLDKVRTCIEEWITVDTLIYIFGEAKVRQILNEKKMGEHFDKLKVTELEIAQQLKYMNICRKLHMQELAEEKFDNAVLEHSLKPLPDFKQLKDDVHDLDLKVKSFYKGVLHEKQDTNFPTKPVKENDVESPTVLPMVDATAQNALRRKVFLNSINKSLKKLIKEIQLEESNTLSNVNDLVKSFKLQAHNIIFKAATWPLIAIILLKMLSLKDSSVQKQLEEENSIEYLDMILSEYNGVEIMMEQIFNLFSDMDKFVEYYIIHGR